MIGLVGCSNFRQKPSRKYISKNIGHPWKGDNSKSINELGMKYRPIEKSAITMYQQMIDNNFSFDKFK